VSVSDQPCTSAGCPGGRICRHVTTVDRSTACPSCGGAVNPQNYDIDCGGATGRYVRVHLPGNGRVLPADVSVNYVKPAVVAQDHLACYAVEARLQTETAPEFVVSEDPRDPVFYSTCFVREIDIDWLPPPGGVADRGTPRFRFGDICIDCASYAAAQLPTNASLLVPPLWRTTMDCKNCNGAALGNADIMCSANVAADESEAVSSGTSGGSEANSGSAVGIAFGVVLAVVGVVVIGFLVHRKRQSTSTRRYTTQSDAIKVENPVFAAKPTMAKPSRKAPRSAPATVDRSRPVEIVDAAPRTLSRSNSDEDALVIKASCESSGAVSQLAQLVETKRTPPSRQPPKAGARPPMPSRKPAVATRPQVASKPPVAKKPARKPPVPRPPSVVVQSQWEAVVDEEDGAVYFYDPVTDKTQWESPFAPCWRAEVDDDHEVYFVNTETGESQWEVPSDASDI